MNNGKWDNLTSEDKDILTSYKDHKEWWIHYSNYCIEGVYDHIFSNMLSRNRSRIACKNRFIELHSDFPTDEEINNILE